MLPIAAATPPAALEPEEPVGALVVVDGEVGTVTAFGADDLSRLQPREADSERTARATFAHDDGDTRDLEHCHLAEVDRDGL